MEPLHILDGTGRKQSLGSCGNSSSDTEAENIQLISELNAAKLKIEEPRSKVMKNNVAMKTMKKAIVELKKQVNRLES